MYLLRWRCLKSCSKRGAMTLCRIGGNNVFFQRMGNSNFPFDSGWINTFPLRRLTSSVVKSSVHEKADNMKIFLEYKKNAPSRIKLLMDYFDMNRSQAQKIAEKDPRLRECDPYSLLRSIMILKESGLNPVEVQNCLQLLYYCPLTVEHQIAILQEMNLINLKAYHYKMFKKIFKSPLQLIKDHGLLPSEYNPKWDVLKAMQVPEETIDEIKFPNKIMALSLAQIHKELSARYLQWRLQCTKDEIIRIHRIYPPTKLKSMKLQQQVLFQLNSDWDIQNAKVLRHGYLLSGSPNNLTLIKECIKHLAGAKTQDAVALAPRILNVPYQKLLQSNTILNGIGLEPGAVLSIPQIFTLNPETLQNRLSSLQLVPEFDALRTHPRILRLLYYNTKVKSRLELLQTLKDGRSIPSLNILSGDKDKFHRYLTIGELKQNRRDVVTFLAKNFKLKSSRIRDMLKQQIYGPHTTVVNVKKNLHLLLEKGFTKEQVLTALEVVVYPPDLVCDQLAQLPKNPEVQPYSEYIKNTNALQLLLYYMEKNSSYRI